MAEQTPATMVLCGEFQRLLEECERARTMWDKRRTEVSGSRLVGKETGDELLRLQAKYARAYAICQKHVNVCWLCRAVSKIA